MTSIADLMKDERHHTEAETRYWCNQYKQVALALKRERDEALALAEANRLSVEGLVEGTAELVADRDRLRALLREWWESVDECPFCGQWKTDHLPDCRLVAALG